MPMAKPGSVGYAVIELQHGERETKQVYLLAVAEESFCQAAGVLQPMVKAWVNNDPVDNFPAFHSQMSAGLHLLEEAMAAHNRYMESLK